MKYKETEEEYTLRILNEAFTSKRHRVTPQYLAELDKRAAARRKEKMNASKEKK